MLSAFSIALSALNADSTAVDVVGNNLANLNTTGFKGSDVSFQDLVNTAITGTNSQAGFGVLPPRVTQEFSQGTIQSSSGPYDSAIQGNGFYVLNDAAGNQMFTRNGNFTVDGSNNLVTQTGLNVEGWEANNGVVNANGPVGNLSIPLNLLNKAAATTNFSSALNLNAAANADATSTFQSTVPVYDSLGGLHQITVTFQKTASNTWSYSASIPSADLSSTSTTTNPLATGTLTFNTDGTLVDPSASGNKAPIPIAVAGLSDGAANLNMNWNLFDSSGNGYLTQDAAPSAPSGTTADGHAAGTYSGVSIGANGVISATFTGGKPVVLGQLALASIANPDTLAETNGGVYQLTQQTGIPSIGASGTGGRGTIVPNSLESSTVDIATEFTNLIVYQRSYEANGKVITTADQLSQDTIALKTP